jgi:hypothetical protein
LAGGIARVGKDYCYTLLSFGERVFGRGGSLAGRARDSNAGPSAGSMARERALARDLPGMFVICSQPQR